MTGVFASGVDGYRGGWVAVELDAGGRAPARTAAALAGLLDHDGWVVGVDIPIGMPENGPRPADVEARRFVGPRGATVFPTPPRAVLAAPTYADARRIAVELTGKSVSAQAYGLRHRILEADALAREDERIVEVHPEVSFCALAGRPLATSKHTAAGLAERRALLAGAGLALPERPPGVPEADLLDAAAAAWSAARYARGEASPLPSGHTGRVGAIWR